MNVKPMLTGDGMRIVRVPPEDVQVLLNAFAETATGVAMAQLLEDDGSLIMERGAFLVLLRLADLGGT